MAKAIELGKAPIATAFMRLSICSLDLGSAALAGSAATAVEVAIICSVFVTSSFVSCVTSVSSVNPNLCEGPLVSVRKLA